MPETLWRSSALLLGAQAAETLKRNFEEGHFKIPHESTLSRSRLKLDAPQLRIRYLMHYSDQTPKHQTDRQVACCWQQRAKVVLMRQRQKALANEDDGPRFIYLSTDASMQSGQDFQMTLEDSLLWKHARLDFWRRFANVL